jgi:uncharacterized protein YaaQ
MRTVTIQIGNSDDRLSQRSWAEFYEKLEFLLHDRGNEVHFAGTSGGNMPWQNACFVILVEDRHVNGLKEQISGLGRSFKQGSIAWTVGETEFI